MCGGPVPGSIKERVGTVWCCGHNFTKDVLNSRLAKGKEFKYCPYCACGLRAYCSNTDCNYLVEIHHYIKYCPNCATKLVLNSRFQEA